ncbi:hypothetical protein [Methylocella silvestris]|uniref:Uncharacterized protein n=1 Tax=Methylocella silvestris TaxID=199596 RepID=A0A2J7TJT4_METSI|nr:hypothetical protein [Methylocella silvestris]PNG27026.1 hypothetical protein CR492_04800 [Methylocella silvestris]
MGLAVELETARMREMWAEIAAVKVLAEVALSGVFAMTPRDVLPDLVSQIRAAAAGTGHLRAPSDFAAEEMADVTVLAIEKIETSIDVALGLAGAAR